MHVIFYVCEEQISVLNVHIVSIIVTLSVCVWGGIKFKPIFVIHQILKNYDATDIYQENILVFFSICGLLKTSVL